MLFEQNNPFPINEKVLVLITNTTFSVKSGATYQRLMLYTKALFLKNIPVVFSSLYTNFDKDEKPKFIEDNIYSIGDIFENQNSSRKSFPILKEFNFVQNFKYLQKLSGVFKERVNIVYLLYPSNFTLSFLTLFYFQCIKKNKVYIEKNELHLGVALNLSSPSGIRNLIILPVKVLQFLISALNDATELFFNGMICISTRMEKLYKPFYKQIIRIPIIADLDKLSREKPINDSFENFRICYTGTISEKRDGIFTFIKSLKAFLDKKDQIVLNLYGPITPSNYKKLNDLIKKNGLSSVVKYHGMISSNEVFDVLKDHDLLILPRPLNIQTNYGFSTKLAEYLSSGVPVLSTRVSDVSNYIVDKENGFLIDNLNTELLINKLNYILSNKSTLNSVGKEGRRTALLHFNYVDYSEKLNNFLFGKYEKGET